MVEEIQGLTKEAVHYDHYGLANNYAQYLKYYEEKLRAMCD